MPEEMITYSSNGGTATGYFSPPAGKKGPGVVVIQEWWGLVPHIKNVADRFAGAGFLALAPDLYHGKATTSPDEAGKLMMAMNIDQAEKELAAVQTQAGELRKKMADTEANMGKLANEKLSMEKEMAEMKDAMEKASKTKRR